MSNTAYLERAGRAGVALAASFAFFAAPNVAEAAVNLRTADPFVVLAGERVTNTGTTTLNGSLGVFPGSAVTGDPIVVPPGTTEIGNDVARQAKADLETAFGEAAAEPNPILLDSGELGGRRLVPGTFDVPTAAQLNGTLTLDASANPNGQFVIRIPSTLTTFSGSSVNVIGGSPCNVFFRVADSATLGTNTMFQGNVLARTSIAAQTGTTVQGRLLALDAAVTLDNNVIDKNTRCAGSSGGSDTTTSDDDESADDDEGSESSSGDEGTTTEVAGTARPTTTDGTATLRRTSPFGATVGGEQIESVVFRRDGRRVPSRIGSPFTVSLRGAPGRYRVTAFVTFKDATRAKSLTLNYRAGALRPRRGPSRLTG